MNYLCGHALPNQDTLRLYNQFGNPSRLSILRSVNGVPAVIILCGRKQGDDKDKG